MLAPALDDDLRPQQRSEDLFVEHLVAQSAVRLSQVAVLTGTAGLDVQRVNCGTGT